MMMLFTALARNLTYIVNTEYNEGAHVSVKQYNSLKSYMNNQVRRKLFESPILWGDGRCNMRRRDSHRCSNCYYPNVLISLNFNTLKLREMCIQEIEKLYQQDSEKVVTRVSSKIQRKQIPRKLRGDCVGKISQRCTDW